MSAPPTSPGSASMPPASPSIYVATTVGDGSGRVFKGLMLTYDQAIAERQAGRDIVVCGPVELQNARWAQNIEYHAGRCKRCNPHTTTAGSQALPHFQQINKPPQGHSFYETATQNAS